MYNLERNNLEGQQIENLKTIFRDMKDHYDNLNKEVEPRSFQEVLK